MAGGRCGPLVAARVAGEFCRRAWPGWACPCGCSRGDAAERIDAAGGRERAPGPSTGTGATSPGRSRRTRRSRPRLEGRGILARSHNGSLGREPWEVLRAGGEPYKVFTPFWRAWVAQGALPEPLPRAGTGRRAGRARPGGAGGTGPAADRPGLGRRVCARPGTPGEAAAWTSSTVSSRAGSAATRRARDFPADAGVSRLSPRLHHGELSPRQLWHRARGGRGRRGVPAPTGLARVRLPPAVPLPAARPTRRCGREFARFPWARRHRPVPRLDAAAVPATPWSTPACASSGTPATCTTGCG